MTIYLISDTHFDHDNIRGYCGRPFDSVEEMNERMIQNWNRTVKPDDTVFHLGDFSWGNPNKFLKRLAGKEIIIVKGNHDDRSLSCIESMMIQTHGELLQLCHDPAVPRWNTVLCGHHHEQWKYQIWEGRIIVNMSVENWDYTPVSIENVIKVIHSIRKQIQSGKDSISRDLGSGVSPREKTPLFWRELCKAPDTGSCAGVAGAGCD